MTTPNPHTMATPEPVDPRRVRIELSAFGRNGRVWIGDNEVSGVIRAVDARAHVHGITEITLSLVPSTLEMVAEGRGQFDTATHEALVALGWTPPDNGPTALDDRLLCKNCDVYVGYGAVGVVTQPKGKSHEWLSSHCWMCKRDAATVRKHPWGRP